MKRFEFARETCVKEDGETYVLVKVALYYTPAVFLADDAFLILFATDHFDFVVVVVVVRHDGQLTQRHRSSVRTEHGVPVADEESFESKSRSAAVQTRS
jgi:hypothetical protein